MSRMGYNAEQEAALVECSRDRLRFLENLTRRVMIGGEDYSSRVQDLGYGKEDGIAVVLEAVLLAALPGSLEGEECRVDWIAHPSGEPLPGFKGKVVRLKVDGPVTQLTAATGGYEAGRTPVGDGPEDDREYAGARPDAVLYDGLEILSGEYDAIQIPRVPEPRITLRDADAVRWTSYVLDLIGLVRDQASLVASDLPTNVASAYLAGALDQAGVSQAESWTFEEGRDTEPGGVTVESAEEERYARVIVWRANRKTGGHEALTRPVKVDNRGAKVNPRSTYFVEYTDEDSALGEQPYAKGYKEAQRLGRNEARLTISPKYPPFFLTRGDVVIAVKRTSVATGEATGEAAGEAVRLSTYRVLLDAVPVENTGGSPAGEAELVSEIVEEIVRPQAPRAPVFAPALWGRDVDGAPFFDDSLPWVSREQDSPEESYVVLDTEIAALHGVEVSRDPLAEKVIEVIG